jgi:hypothetical protein
LSGSIGLAEAAMKSSRTWRTRLAGWLGFDRNPLRRTSDRVEAWLVLLVMVAFVPLSVLVASSAGSWVRSTSLRDEHFTNAQQVSAVLVAGPEVTSPAFGLPPREWALARWRLGRTTYTGEVSAAYGTTRGATVRIWVNHDGQVVGTSLTAGQLEDQVIATEAVAPLVLALALMFALCALRWLMNRRRFAGWEAEWRSIDPRRARRPE